MIGHIIHVALWTLLVLVGIATIGFQGANYTDTDPEWTRDQRVAAGLVLGLMTALIAFLAYQTYPF